MNKTKINNEDPTALRSRKSKFKKKLKEIYTYDYSYPDNQDNKHIITATVKENASNTLFPYLETKPNYEIAAEKIEEIYIHKPQYKENYIQLHNRRYIGNKFKLVDWIFSVISKECSGSSFADIFAGTGVISAVASKIFDKIIINDFLHSNFVIYNAFFGGEEWSVHKIIAIIEEYNGIKENELEDNYFSENFGGKFFSYESAKKIGFIRESIEENKKYLKKREYFMLISSLLYSTDKIANTVGHYDAYFKDKNIVDNFIMKPIDPILGGDIEIYQKDSNLLAREIKADIAYIDPPYNSRQYSRFYHVLETLTKWDKPKLHGVALKPEPENMSDYCRVNAKEKLRELVKDIQANFLVVSYNNTYESKSNSSKNKITLFDIEEILKAKGDTKVFEKNYRHFNAGNTDFNNHKEFLFVTKTRHD